PMIAIDFKEDLAAFATNLFVIELLNAAKANFIRTDEPQHVRRERIVRIETLWLLARIDALKFKRVELRRSLHFQTASDPNELLICVSRVGQLLCEILATLIRNSGDFSRCIVGISYLAGIGEERFSIETAGQFSSL